METQLEQEVPMTTLTLAPITTETVRVKSTKRREPVPAGRVQDLLREIVIAMHATRVVGKVGRLDQDCDSDE
jgi:hypothetical protein